MNGAITDFLVVADQIFIMVLLIGAGYVAISTKIVDPRATRGLSGLLINITLPALSVALMQVPFTPERLAGAETLVLATGALYIIAFAIAWAVSKAIHPSIVCGNSFWNPGWPAHAGGWPGRTQSQGITHPILLKRVGKPRSWVQSMFQNSYESDYIKWRGLALS